jgi:glycosyltransferase involved in cell wall biosynthesis
MYLVFGAETISGRLTGIGHYSKELLKAFVASGAFERIDCFTGSRFVEAEAFLAGLEATETASQPPAAWKHALITKMQQFPLSYTLRSARRNQAFRKLRAANKSNLIYHEPAFILKPFAGKKIASVHDLSHKHYPEFHPKGRVAFIEKNLKRTLRDADHIVTVSAFVRDELIELYAVPPENISVVYNGSRSLFRPRNTDECRHTLDTHGLSYGDYILCVATLEPRKNLIPLIKAYLTLREQGKANKPLVLVGVRGWNSELDTELNDALRKGYVRMPGYLDDDALAHIYSGADGLCFPSIYEGFGLPVVEAMASGVPVLTSENSSMAEIAGGHAILTNPHSIDDMAAGLDSLLHEEETRTRCIAGGLEQAKQFNWQQAADQLIALYQKL